MHEPYITILTGNIQTGKTTYLSEQFVGRSKVYGIITPVVNGKRMFQDLSSGEMFLMEAGGIENIFLVGRYKFSEAAFAKANEILEKGLNKKAGTLILDEVGPLELKGQGFYGIMQKIVADRNANLKKIIVVREQIADNVIEVFKIKNVQFLRL